MSDISKLRGVIVPVGTPLAAGDRVDEDGLRRLTRYLLNAGVHGILVNGSMGGFAFLTDDEQERSLSIVLDEVSGAIPVLAGLGETSTSRAVRRARKFAAAGVHSLSVLPPFYFMAAQEHLVKYFSEIAESVECPIFLYDNPSLTKNPIHPETVADLRRRVPTIVGIKESNQDCANLQKLLRVCQGDPPFSILIGSESLLVVALQMGCDGFVGGLHNICPALAVALYDAFVAGDLPRARELQQQLIDVAEIFRFGHIWGGFDEALRYLEICERATGAPYVTALTPDERASVQVILDRSVKPSLARVDANSP
jgi:4-hydroxy-tetrahydrodipicolinate synthase